QAAPGSPSSHRSSQRGHGARACEEAAVARLLVEGAAAQEDLAAEQRHPWPPARRPSLVWCEARDAQMLLLLDGPRRRRVPDGQISVGAHADGALAWIEPEDARGILSHHACQPG